MTIKKKRTRGSGSGTTGLANHQAKRRQVASRVGINADYDPSKARNLSVRLSEPEYELLKKAAQHKGVSMSYWMTEAAMPKIIQYAKRHELEL